MMELVEILNYAWLIPIIPVASFVLVGLFGKKTPYCGGLIAILGAALSCVASVAVSYAYLTSDLYANGQPFSMAMEWKIGRAHV